MHEGSDGWDQLHYDHRSSKVTVAPWDLWKRLRDQCPAIHSDHYGGFWFVSRHEDVNRVLVDWETFTAAEGTNIPRQAMLMLPLECDPPLHRQYRTILNPQLAPQKVTLHEGWIRAEAQQLLAELKGRDRFDLVNDYAEPLARTLAMRVIGYDEADLPKLAHWTHVLSVGTRDDEEGMQVAMEFFGYLAATLMARAEEPPRDDLISLLFTGTIDGRPLTFEEQQSVLLLLTFGGLHTTGTVLSGALVWLADHPEDRARLRADPEVLGTAVDEFVRYVSPVTHMSRTAAVDTELGGCPIRAGEKVLFGIGSANHDERVFDGARGRRARPLPQPPLRLRRRSAPVRRVPPRQARCPHRPRGVPGHLRRLRDRGPSRAALPRRRGAPPADRTGRGARPMIRRITIDGCTGHGRCYDVCPEVFEPDEEGYSRLRDVEVEAGTELDAGLSRAVAACPERAISVG